MTHSIDQFFLNREEPLKSYFLALRSIVLKFDDQLDERLSYGVPFYYYKNKPFCYFWKDKKSNEPYIGMARGHLLNHKMLYQGDRKKMKVIPLALDKDIPIKLIYEIFEEAQRLY